MSAMSAIPICPLSITLGAVRSKRPVCPRRAGCPQRGFFIGYTGQAIGQSSSCDSTFSCTPAATTRAPGMYSISSSQLVNKYTASSRVGVSTLRSAMTGSLMAHQGLRVLPGAPLAQRGPQCLFIRRDLLGEGQVWVGQRVAGFDLGPRGLDAADHGGALIRGVALVRQHQPKRQVEELVIGHGAGLGGEDVVGAGHGARRPWAAACWRP